MTHYMTRLLKKILLIVLPFLAALAIVSNTFDGDLGWHLRFGQEAWAGNFQYLDSWTYTFFSQPWVNHEWGGDLLFWFFYDKFGYFSLNLLVALALASAFFITQKTFFKKLSPADWLLALAFILSVKFLLVARLAMLAPLFFALLWLTLEKLPNKKTYYWWPLILWAWSALHGSWILGFILINIYLVGNAVAYFLNKKFPSLAGKNTGWTVTTFKNAILWQIISAAVVCLNPYGWKIWSEIAGYFLGGGYFKLFINEWLPSWTYPVYPWPLIIAAAGAVFVFLGWRGKKISLAQGLLFIALLTTALLHKRNNIFIVLVCLPLASGVWREIKERMNYRPRPMLASIIIIAVAGLAGVFFLTKIHYSADIWRDDLLKRYPFPIGATEFLKQKTAGQQVKIFNEFWWGGYLNWTLPNALVFLDGRGTATWLDANGSPLLAEYRKIKFEEGELNKISAQYIILNKNHYGYPQPDRLNRIIFDKNDFAKLFPQKKSALEEELTQNAEWTKIYDDGAAAIWEKK